MFEIISIYELLKRLDKYNHKEGHFHHTYLPSMKDYDGTDTCAQRLQQGMKDYHVNINHWTDIGQHVTLLPDGRFITGRDFSKTPASILGYNEGAFACETLGNFDTGNDTLTGPQKESALKLAKYFDDKGKYFRFHRENAAKTCPGSGINKDVFMAQARGQVVAVAAALIAAHSGNELVRQLQELDNEAGLRDAQGCSLKVDGIWGTNTQTATPMLRKGITRNRPGLKWIVRFLQKMLLALGYSLPRFGADGDFGTETMNAVIAYQKANHLVADGIVGPITWCRILGV